MTFYEDVTKAREGLIKIMSLWDDIPEINAPFYNEPLTNIYNDIDDAIIFYTNAITEMDLLAASSTEPKP